MSAVVLLLVTVAWAICCGLAVVVWRRAQDQLDADRQVFLLHFPPGLAFEWVVAFLRAVASISPMSSRPLAGVPTVVLETVATTGPIHHLLRLPVGRASQILGQLRTAVPGLVASPLVAEAESPAWRRVTEIRPHTTERMLRTDQPETSAAAILASLQP